MKATTSEKLRPAGPAELKDVTGGFLRLPFKIKLPFPLPRFPLPRFPFPFPRPC